MLFRSRLKDEGYVDTYLEESSEGPPRKYYKITQGGRDWNKSLLEEWLTFSAAVSRITEAKK